MLEHCPAMHLTIEKVACLLTESCKVMRSHMYRHLGNLSPNHHALCICDFADPLQVRIATVGHTVASA